MSLPLDLDTGDLEIVIVGDRLWINIHERCELRIDRVGVVMLSVDGEVSVLHATLERSQ